MQPNIINSLTIEKKALIVGAVINLVMAISGWIAFYLSNSEALLLDGNFSFIVFLSTIVAIKISSIKSVKNETFPFGLFIYEALYALLKGLMIIGMLLLAFTENVSKIVHFMAGGETGLLNSNVILVYSILMTLLCFILAAYYKHQNRKMGNISSILLAEYIAAILDGFMSAGIGIALVGITVLPPGSSLGFLNYIGDAILVIILCLLLGKEPFILVKNSFIELVGGTLQNAEEKEKIEQLLQTNFSVNNLLLKSHISKTGSSYLIIAYLNSHQLDDLGYQKITDMKNKITEQLNNRYPDSLFEMVLH